MKKTLASLLTMLLLLPACALNSNLCNRYISNRMESSSVLMHMKIQMVTKDEDTGKEKIRSGWGTCSGVYIKDNVILSAAHCVDMHGEENITLKGIWIRSGQHSAPAVVIKVDPAADLVLLYTPLRGIPIKFARTADRGEECFVVGNPLGLQDVMTKGIVSRVGLAQKEEKAVFLIIDAIVLPGNSGGPVVDSGCHLIGILTRSTSMMGPLGASGLGMAVDLQTIRNFLKS